MNYTKVFAGKELQVSSEYIRLLEKGARVPSEIFLKKAVEVYCRNDADLTYVLKLRNNLRTSEADKLAELKKEVYAIALRYCDEEETLALTKEVMNAFSKYTKR